MPVLLVSFQAVSNYHPSKHHRSRPARRFPRGRRLHVVAPSFPFEFAILQPLHQGFGIEPVLPGRELDNFYAQISCYYLNHGNLNNIPIGFDGINNFYIVIDNNSGQVKLEDYEKNKIFFLAESLEELISGIKFNN